MKQDKLRDQMLRATRAIAQESQEAVDAASQERFQIMQDRVRTLEERIAFIEEFLKIGKK